jgi:hypothetical protein
VAGASVSCFGKSAPGGKMSSATLGEKIQGGGRELLLVCRNWSQGQPGRFWKQHSHASNVLWRIEAGSVGDHRRLVFQDVFIKIVARIYHSPLIVGNLCSCISTFVRKIVVVQPGI